MNRFIKYSMISFSLFQFCYPGDIKLVKDVFSVHQEATQSTESLAEMLMHVAKILHKEYNDYFQSIMNTPDNESSLLSRVSLEFIQRAAVFEHYIKLLRELFSQDALTPCQAHQCIAYQFLKECDELVEQLNNSIHQDKIPDKKTGLPYLAVRMPKWSPK